MSRTHESSRKYLCRLDKPRAAGAALCDLGAAGGGGWMRDVVIKDAMSALDGPAGMIADFGVGRRALQEVPRKPPSMGGGAKVAPKTNAQSKAMAKMEKAVSAPRPPWLDPGNRARMMEQCSRLGA